MLATEQQQAQNDLISSLTNKTQGDSAALMARYGTNLAMAGAQTSPLISNTTGGVAAPRAA
jgi:hypothetical protein